MGGIDGNDTTRGPFPRRLADTVEAVAVFCAVYAATAVGGPLVAAPARAVLGDQAGATWTVGHEVPRLLSHLGGLATAVLLLGVYLRWRTRGRLSDIALDAPLPWRSAGRGLLVGLLLGAGTLALAPSGPGGVGPTRVVALGVLVLAGLLARGTAEELMARGWLLHALARSLPLPLAIALQALLSAFALVLLGEVRAVAGLVAAFGFGVFAALYVVWDRTLWGVCALHGAFAFTAGPLAAAFGRAADAPVAALPPVLVGIVLLTAALRRRGGLPR
ncbi:CPBP family intramembrane glutamic endopeptidase [Marinactinospora thermotolerans]|uniref:CAAX protease self-immunity n=1 Tax=Marinactinospora thermotolerans DSM 45154 TaxID=1122192 RepID=A0A1T4T3R2_9ACTN|nr:CPBP family intramembrane glutamic endopeptidase [Marinactinospora thermotolerans]SKA34881.1 CAAX protease self-immunity [Marinactinospora thermotolerans DSM 45154]